MPMPTKVVEVVPYDEKWEIEFNRIKDMLESYIGDLVLKIEHVGSTSIKGLYAKPIIDVDVVIDSYDELPKIVDKLAKEGYVHEGNLGVEGREAFRRNFDDGMMKYHLYVCPKDGKGYLEHIALREYLRNNKEARDNYSKLKLQLAKEYKYDIDTYCDKKTEFIQDILNRTIYAEEKGKQ